MIMYSAWALDIITTNIFQTGTGAWLMTSYCIMIYSSWRRYSLMIQKHCSIYSRVIAKELTFEDVYTSPSMLCITQVTGDAAVGRGKPDNNGTVMEPTVVTRMGGCCGAEVRAEGWRRGVRREGGCRSRCLDSKRDLDWNNYSTLSIIM